MTIRSCFSAVSDQSLALKITGSLILVFISSRSQVPKRRLGQELLHIGHRRTMRYNKPISSDLSFATANLNNRQSSTEYKSTTLVLPSPMKERDRQQRETSRSPANIGRHFVTRLLVQRTRRHLFTSLRYSKKISSTLLPPSLSAQNKPRLFRPGFHISFFFVQLKLFH